jgi:hypothetical protein
MIADISRELGIYTQIFYNLKKKHSVIDGDRLKRLILKTIYFNAALDIKMIMNIL